MTKISDLRISWIWTETFPDLLSSPSPLQSPWGELMSGSDYATAFASAQAGGGALLLPWGATESNHIHYFWTYYLEQNPYQVPADEAYRRLVPFRGRTPAKVLASVDEARVILECYHYPHGLGLVVTLQLKQDLPLKKAVGLAVDAARTDDHEVTWPDGSTGQVSVTQLGFQTLDRLRASTFGAGTVQGRRSIKPFSVATVVRGSGVDPKVANTQDSDVHRALEALCRWSPNWENDVLSPMAGRTIPIRQAPASHWLYGTDSGRAVWFPDSFAATTGKKSSLGCYHRNLLLASLQTESLCQLMVLGRERMMLNQPVSIALNKVLRNGAGVLGRLYGADKATYRSASPTRQIDDNGWTQAVNYIRHQVGGMLPLHP